MSCSPSGFLTSPRIQSRLQLDLHVSSVLCVVPLWTVNEEYWHRGIESRKYISLLLCKLEDVIQESKFKLIPAWKKKNRLFPLFPFIDHCRPQWCCNFVPQNTPETSFHVFFLLWPSTLILAHRKEPSREDSANSWKAKKLMLTGHEY